MDHHDLNPIACSRGELYDAYQDQIARTSKVYDEVLPLSLRQGALEAFITTLVEGTLDGQRCRLKECMPAWDQQLGRYVQVAPCRMAAGEELLRKHVRTRTHHGVGAPDVRSPRAAEVFGGQGHASIETDDRDRHPTRRRAAG